jgi:large subunit ribosomal protein L28
MARKCSITKVGPQAGHSVSHANNKTKRRFNVNLQKKRIFVRSLGKTLRIKLSTSALRTIDKIGLEAALAKNKLTLQDIN